MSSGSPATSLAGGGSSSNQSGPHASGSNNNPNSNAPFPGSAASMLQSNAASMPALINGLISAAGGGGMMPPPGVGGLPLGGAGGRDLKDFSAEDQKVCDEASIVMSVRPRMGDNQYVLFVESCSSGCGRSELNSLPRRCRWPPRSTRRTADVPIPAWRSSSCRSSSGRCSRLPGFL